MTKDITVRTFTLICIMVLILTSCADRTAQEVQRSMQSETIIAYSEQENTTLQSGTNDLIDNDNETLPSWGGGPNHKPHEFAFNLTLSEELLIVDYDKTSANVYQAEYSDLRPLWNEEWYTYGFGEIQKWCVGSCIMVSSDEIKGENYYDVQDHDTSIQNIRSVELVPISTIKEYEKVVEKQGIERSRKVLCWTYTIKDFPQQLGDYAWFEAPTNLDTIKYIRVSPQYIDDLPVYGKCSGCGIDTFEWPGVIGPSCIGNEGALEIVRVNPSNTCMFDIERRTYTIKKSMQSNISIVDPVTCLDEIEKALKYDPCVNAAKSVDPNKEDLYHIWGNDVEVYCMELTYAAFDSTYPINADATEEKLRQHNICLIPVWEVYYYITNPDNELTISNGTVMINALTGKSLFSDEYGPGANIK